MNETGEESVTATRPMIRRRLQAMDPDTFEYFVADLWEYFSWQTHVVGAPGDKGIDVVATATSEGGAQKQLIQAKRYGPNTTVGSPEVQQYAALRLQEDDVDQVTIVTTGTFSAQAEEMAPDLDVIAVDGEELIGLVLEVDAIELIAEYFDDIELASEVETSEDDGFEQRGVLDRIRSLF